MTRARWLVVAALVFGACAKKGSSCDSAKAVATQAIETARIALTTQVETAMVREAKLADQRLALATKGAPVPPDLDQQQAGAAAATARLQLDLRRLDSWRAQLVAASPPPISPAPEPGEAAELAPVRTAIVAAVAQCAS